MFLCHSYCQLTYFCSVWPGFVSVWFQTCLIWFRSNPDLIPNQPFEFSFSPPFWVLRTKISLGFQALPNVDSFCGCFLSSWAFCFYYFGMGYFLTRNIHFIMPWRHISLSTTKGLMITYYYVTECVYIITKLINTYFVEHDCEIWSCYDISLHVIFLCKTNFGTKSSCYYSHCKLCACFRQNIIMKSTCSSTIFATVISYTNILS